MGAAAHLLAASGGDPAAAAPRLRALEGMLQAGLYMVQARGVGLDSARVGQGCGAAAGWLVGWLVAGSGRACACADRPASPLASTPLLPAFTPPPPHRPQLGASREHEYEADRLALELGAAAGLADPRSLAAGARATLAQFLRMEAQAGGGGLAAPPGAPDNPMSTHPAAANRLKRLALV